MLLLIETPAGFALFQTNTKALSKVDNIYDYLQDKKQANKLYLYAIYV